MHIMERHFSPKPPEVKPSCRELLDPEQTLPRFTIEAYDHLTWPGMVNEREKWRFFPDDEQWPPIGRCDVFFEEDRVHFDGIEIDEAYRGTGMGLAIYIAAIERAHEKGLPFVTQEAGQSEDAKRVWEYLAQKGVARVVTPFEAGEVRNGRQKYYGHYIVDVDTVQ